MAQTKQFAPMEKVALGKEITSIGKAGNALNKRVQIAALNAIHYSIAECYIQYADNLVMALTNGHRKNTLVAFFEKHGQLQWSKEQKQFVCKKRAELTLESVSEISEQWYDTIKAPEPVSSINVESKFESWLKNITKQANEATNSKHTELLEILADAHAKWHAEQCDVLDEEEEIVEEISSLMELAVNSERKELRAA